VKWIAHGKVPDKWRPWLFGGAEPAGSFVVDLPPQRLREEMSLAGILGGAGLDASTYWEWQKDRLKKRALKWAIAWTAATGARENLTPPWPDWASTLPTRTKNNLLRYAKAATRKACCDRTLTGPPGTRIRFDDYCKKRAEAERLGVGDLLEKFLRHAPPFSRPFHGPKRGPYCGLVAENFFIPSKGMIAFREAARKEATRVKLAQAVRPIMDHPAFHTFFLDWTNPRATRGQWLGLSQRNGDPSTGPSAMFASHVGGSVLHGKSKNKRGPEKTEQTIEIEDFCYDALKAGEKKTRAIANEVKVRYKKQTFSRAAVSVYARRRAERLDDPRPWPITR
jgi:hypothetical protein